MELIRQGLRGGWWVSGVLRMDCLLTDKENKLMVAEGKSKEEKN